MAFGILCDGLCPNTFFSGKTTFPSKLSKRTSYPDIHAHIWRAPGTVKSVMPSSHYSEETTCQIACLPREAFLYHSPTLFQGWGTSFSLNPFPKKSETIGYYSGHNQLWKKGHTQEFLLFGKINNDLLSPSPFHFIERLQKKKMCLQIKALKRTRSNFLNMNSEQQTVCSNMPSAESTTLPTIQI